LFFFHLSLILSPLFLIIIYILKEYLSIFNFNSINVLTIRFEKEIHIFFIRKNEIEFIENKDV
jgi:hypothetical protein